MSKKKGLFSWFKKNEKPNDNELEQQDKATQTQVEDTPVTAPDTPDSDASVDETQQASEIEPTSVVDAATEALENEDTISEPETTAEPKTTDTGAAKKEEIDTVADNTESNSPQAIASNVDEETAADDTNSEAPQKQGFFTRLKQGLSKTRQNLGGGIADLFRGKKIDDELFEELETQLLLADVGVDTTMKIIDNLTEHASRKQLKDAEALYELLKAELKSILDQVDTTPRPEPEGLKVILMVGVNGVGKTTTIGKLAKQFQAQGKSVMLAAGDTFRAAAVEQLQVWGERNDIPVIAQHTGADSASVIFDAVSSAKSKGADILIADTAGRLQNKAHLMEELKKVVRVMKKVDADAPHEVMLTIDAGTGQNALSQTQLFNDAVGLTAINVTKLDGTAKGGVVFALADKFNLPIRYLGVGEGIDDLRPFNGTDFINALFDNEK